MEIWQTTVWWEITLPTNWTGNQTQITHSLHLHLEFVDHHPLHLQLQPLVILFQDILLQEKALEVEVKIICCMYLKTETVVMDEALEARVKNVEKNLLFTFMIHQQSDTIDWATCFLKPALMTAGYAWILLPTLQTRIQRVKGWLKMDSLILIDWVKLTLTRQRILTI